MGGEIDKGGEEDNARSSEGQKGSYACAVSPTSWVKSSLWDTKIPENHWNVNSEIIFLKVSKRNSLGNNPKFKIPS